MTDAMTARLGLPHLRAGQAQKELFHNEALLRLDIAVQGGVIAMDAITPPSAPTPGECWILGAAPEGAWSGNARAIAGWTEGGWRFLAPREGMQFWIGPTRGFALFRGGAWQAGNSFGRLFVDGEQVVGARGPAIASPSGGAVADTEARAAIDTVLSVLRAHGLIKTA